MRWYNNYRIVSYNESEITMDKSSEEYISKKRAINLWDSGKIDDFEIGSVKGLLDIHYSLFHDLDGFDAGKIRKVNISKGNFRFANSM